MSDTATAARVASQLRVDPVTASIIQGALENIAIEMGYKMMRMAYSSIIRESEDFGAALCDAEGRQLCECSKSTPLQSGPIPGYVRGILRQLKARGETIRPGDIIIHNDAYNGASHSPDIGICLPIFHGEELMGFSVTTAHHLDIGSCQPGSVGVVACADSFAEGLCFKALKLASGGERNEALWQMIESNVRVPDLVIGDLEAQIAACRVGAARYLELLERYSAATLNDATEDLLDYSERLMRKQIEAIPDGEYQATGIIDGFIDAEEDYLKNLEIKVTVTVSGSDVSVDLTGSSPQVDGHAINMPFEGTVDVAVWLTLRSVLLDSEVFGSIPQNNGLFRPVSIHAPEGSIANPRFPAPTIARFAPGNVIADTLMKALSQAVPSKVSAGVANLKAIAFSGAGAAAPWVHIEIFEGSYGGRETTDGMDSVDTLYANTRNNPIEDIESHVPLRVTRYELRENQLGAGRMRGGLNSVKEVELLEDTMVSVEGDGHSHVPWGLKGGHEGATSSLELIGSDGSTTALPSMMPARRCSKGSRLRATGGVGGGYGDPLERSEEAVLEDVLDGLLGIEEAARQFGVAIGRDLAIDRSATDKLRAS